VPKNFDDILTKEREFTVRGEKFTFKDASPEVLSSFEIIVNGDDENSVWKSIDAQIVLFLEEKDHERWYALRAREDEPVTIKQLNAVLRWLMEEQTGRPTQPPSTSGSGRGKTEASSKAG
jgi:hypothetical protein